LNEKKRVLFVDDESHILDGLRRMLRPMRDRWDMSFAEGGHNALDVLSKSEFDVIVSDMRMPGIDGEQLLRAVKERYPRIIRIALSGQTSKETIVRSVGLIHQYLSKPCDAEVLKSTVTRVCSFRNLLTNQELLGLVSQLESLPCMSQLHSNLIRELRSDDASIEEISNIICQDVAMAAKIMQLVNSAFFGVRQQVTSISQAITLLGLDIISALVLSVKIFSGFSDDMLKKFSLDSLWAHSLNVSKFAKIIAQAENADRNITDYAMMAGLLHDIGKLALAATTPQQYEQVLSLATKENMPICQAEDKIIGTTHAEIGAYLLGLWNFPDEVIYALAYHHKPAQSDTNNFSVLTAVHLANALENKTLPAKYKTTDVDVNYLEVLGLLEHLAGWRELCFGKHKENAEKISADDVVSSVS
jgi:putative nucleotidyltransferase with HDIG domain